MVGLVFAVACNAFQHRLCMVEVVLVSVTPRVISINKNTVVVTVFLFSTLGAISFMRLVPLPCLLFPRGIFLVFIFAPQLFSLGAFVLSSHASSIFRPSVGSVSVTSQLCEQD